MKELLVCLVVLMLPLWAASASVTECEHYATCTQPGEISYICEGCGAVRKEAAPATGHSWYEASSAAPTCTEKGLITSVCENCQETMTEACTPAAQESAAEDVPAAVIPLPEEAEVTYAAPEAAPQETDIIQLVVEPLAQPDEETAAAPLSPALAAFQAENPRAQIMDISLLVNGEEARPAQKLRIALPVADEIPQGMKLVFINALGEIIEIEYEIIDGKLVFEALELGTFALVPAQI